MANHVLVSCHIVVPMFASRRRGRELPVLLRVVNAFEEPPLLLLLGDVEEELAHHAVPRQVMLEGADVFKRSFQIRLVTTRGSFCPGKQLGVHAHHKHFLVI